MTLTASFTSSILPANSLAFATYVGGSGADRPAGLALRYQRPDHHRLSRSLVNFPTTTARSPAVRKAGIDGFVAKITPDGRSLDFSTYLGGSGDDWAWGVAAGSDNTVFIAGATASTDFPVTTGAVSAALRGERDATLGDGWRLTGPACSTAPTWAEAIWTERGRCGRWSWGHSGHWQHVVGRFPYHTTSL